MTSSTTHHLGTLSAVCGCSNAAGIGLSASLVLSGIGITYSDGIVGRDGMASLRNLGQIATKGMSQTDDEILKIMQEKLKKPLD